MRKMGTSLIMALCATVVFGSNAGAAGVSAVDSGSVSGIGVDGLLGDWGVSTPGTGDNPDNWVPSQGAYAHEDITGGSGFVGPGVGGQDFDAEALYTGFDVTTNTLYVGLVTGFDIGGETNSGDSYYAGDLFIDFGTYLPQTGRNGSNNHVNYNNSGHSWDLAFILDGATSSSTSLDAVGTPNFLYSMSPQGNPGYNSGPLSATGGTDVGSSNFGYTNNWGGGDHNVYEFAYTVTDSNWLSLLDTGGWTAHWTMSCGNDFLDAAGNLPPGTHPNDPPVVPVPAAAPLALFGLAMVGAARKLRGAKGQSK